MYKHFIRFWAEPGDFVRFKRPKKGGELWEVISIEADASRVTWSNDGWIPNYIQLEATTKKLSTGQPLRVWTCENKLRSSGVKKNGKTASSSG